MLWRSGLALILWAGAALAGPAKLQLVSAVEIPRDTPFHGGFSGIEVAGDGHSAMLVSDRGWLFEVAFERQAGTMQAATATSVRWPIPLGDLEGIAATDGVFYVSTEGPPIVSRIETYDMACLPGHRDFQKFGFNRALEALAVDDSGAVFTLPERPPDNAWGLPLYRYADGVWTHIRDLPFDPVFLAVGADIGPDGLFYLLERAVTPVGFRTRIRRFDPSDPIAATETLLTTSAGLHDNLEGISVWTAPDGTLRLTMVSDNNFIRPQRSEVVEYAVRETLAQTVGQD